MAGWLKESHTNHKYENQEYSTEYYSVLRTDSYKYSLVYGPNRREMRS